MRLSALPLPSTNFQPFVSAMRENLHSYWGWDTGIRVQGGSPNKRERFGEPPFLERRSNGAGYRKRQVIVKICGDVVSTLKEQ